MTLYSLPSCGICAMIKAKMHDKNIPFKEGDLELFAQKHPNISHAPVLELDNGQLLTVPVDILKYIEGYESE